MSTHQQPPSQPEDFPDLDLEAWRAALPMPDAQVNALARAIASAQFSLASTALPSKAIEPPLVLGSEVFVSRPPRFRRRPK